MKPFLTISAKVLSISALKPIGLSVNDSYQKYLNPDIDEVQKAMVEIYKNYENKSKKARQRAVEYYNIDNWFETHLKIMRDLLNAK